jgi:hypothetical protein
VAISFALLGAVEAAAQTCPAAPGTAIERVYVVLSQTEQLDTPPIATFAGQGPVAIVHEPSARRWRVPLATPVPLGSLALDASAGRQLALAKPGWMFGQSSEPTVAAETVAGTSRCMAVLGFNVIRAWRVEVTAVDRGKPVAVEVVCDRKACRPSTRTSFTSEWMTAGDAFSMKARFLFDCYLPATLVRDAGATTVDRWTILRQLTPRDCLAPVRLSTLAQIVPDSISLSPLLR